MISINEMAKIGNNRKADGPPAFTCRLLWVIFEDHIQDHCVLKLFLELALQQRILWLQHSHKNCWIPVIIGPPMHNLCHWTSTTTMHFNRLLQQLQPPAGARSQLRRIQYSKSRLHLTNSRFGPFLQHLFLLKDEGTTDMPHTKLSIPSKQMIDLSVRIRHLDVITKWAWIILNLHMLCKQKITRRMYCIFLKQCTFFYSMHILYMFNIEWALIVNRCQLVVDLHSIN